MIKISLIQEDTKGKTSDIYSTTALQAMSKQAITQNDMIK